MKPYLLLISVIVFMSCKEERHCGVYVGNEKLGLDDYWRKVTGYDSLQIFCNAGDKLDYNFCYPNEFNPYEKHKKDTVFIHDTLVVYDIPKRKIKRKLRKLKCNNCDTVFTMFPLYVDSTTVPGKRIIKILK